MPPQIERRIGDDSRARFLTGLPQQAEITCPIDQVVPPGIILNLEFGEREPLFLRSLLEAAAISGHFEDWLMQQPGTQGGESICRAADFRLEQ